MKGILSIEGAYTYAWIPGQPLLDVLKSHELYFVGREGGRLIFTARIDTGPTVAIEISDQRGSAVRYRITDPPSFNWCDMHIVHAEIHMRVGRMGEPVRFIVRADKLPILNGNFRLWALDLLKEWSMKATTENGLKPLLDTIRKKGWMVVEYTPAVGPVSKWGDYSLTIRPFITRADQDYQARSVNWGSWGGFLKAVEHLSEEIPDLNQEREDQDA